MAVAAAFVMSPSIAGGFDRLNVRARRDGRNAGDGPAECADGHWPREAPPFAVAPFRESPQWKK
jgi:hypothetical protein